MRCALLGDNLAQLLAVKNSWAGIVINGCIRDCKEIRKMPVGVKALGTPAAQIGKGIALGPPGQGGRVRRSDVSIGSVRMWMASSFRRCALHIR
jgi:Aldolase/RraA